MTWRTTDLPSFAGRTVVVTGGNSGIGWHTAAALSRRGADVTIACRNVEAGARAASDMRVAGAGEVRVAPLDLADLSSVRAFAEAWDRPLDVLVNNAGVMTPPRYRETVDGFELQFGTNHLGHVALTARLLPHLRAAAAPRVVTVSSIAHHRGSPDLLDGNQGGGYQPERAYGNSKLANLLFAFELDRRARAAGTAVTSVAAHPGYAATSLIHTGLDMGGRRADGTILQAATRVLAQSSAMGAQPTLMAATLPGLAGGSYTGPRGVGEWRGRPTVVTASRVARDPDLARALWSWSEEATGVRFP
jgi:NAD(P)-dependent dehydrogenase (short-subunit alcohol dehydrogenase family)